MTDAKTRATEHVRRACAEEGSLWFEDETGEDALIAVVAAAITEAVAEEREDCLREVLRETDVCGHIGEKSVRRIAHRIRSRGPATPAPLTEVQKLDCACQDFAYEPAPDAPLEACDLPYTSPQGRVVATYRRVDSPDALLEALEFLREAWETKRDPAIGYLMPADLVGALENVLAIAARKGGG